MSYTHQWRPFPVNIEVAPWLFHGACILFPRHPKRWQEIKDGNMIWKTEDAGLQLDLKPLFHYRHYGPLGPLLTWAIRQRIGIAVQVFMDMFFYGADHLWRSGFLMTLILRSLGCLIRIWIWMSSVHHVSIGSGLSHAVHITHWYCHILVTRFVASVSMLVAADMMTNWGVTFHDGCSPA